MIKEHNAQIPSNELTMYLYWDKLDPIYEWECIRNDRIAKGQGLGNSFVDEVCKVNLP
ncbi:endonuclease [Colwellia echini]|uniref:Uncharacterized protein n=1 Tax=Colwellia echini TaxID=1982103 RepID=A0ABY3MXR7_9GAMM|nr:hypothetical protein CWS31_007010 [Colwellia echini]